MPRAFRWRFNIAVSITFLIVSASYELKQNFPDLKGPLGWLVWMMSIILANVGLTWIWNLAIHVRCFRRALLGATWLEGSWFFHTTEFRDDGQEIVQVGIAEFSYQLPAITLQGIFFNLALAGDEETDTKSISIAVDENLNYMHYFLRHAQNRHAAGVAVGSFVCLDGKPPQSYSGAVIYFETEEKHKRKQVGEKLTKKQVREYSAALGSGWRKLVIHDREFRNQYLDRKIPLPPA